MRLHLELEHNDKYQFVELQSPVLGPYKALLVEIDGRKFSSWYRMESYRLHDPGYVQHIEEMLARQFEAMLQKLLGVALAKVPNGVAIMEKTDEELSQLIYGKEVSP